MLTTDARVYTKVLILLSAWFACSFIAGGCKHNSQLISGDTLHLYISAGQSNMDGRADKNFPYANLNKTVTGVNVWAWSKKNHKSFKDFEYDANNGGQAPGTTQWAGDIIVWKKIYDSIFLERREVFAMKTTLNGSALAPDIKSKFGSWCYPQDSVLPGKPRMLDTLANRFNSICQLYPDKKVVTDFLMWHLGEGDADSIRNQLAFEYRLKRTFAAIRTIVKNPQLPIIMGTVSRASIKYREPIHSAMLKVAAEDPFVFMIELDGVPLKKDRLHFDDAGQTYFGNEAFKIVKGFVKY